MARFSDEWIERVKSSVDIVEVIGRHIQLRPSGRNFVGLCPFHDEKTPSFSVNPERQFYYCFGCRAGGNVINFVMHTEHLSFPEAVTKLAQETGIPVPSLSPQAEARESKRDKLRKLNELAARYYYRNLRNPAGQGARNYLEGRGIDEKLARNFYLGYAGQEWDGLVLFLQSQNVDLTMAEAAGLIVPGNRGYIDRFRNRIIFPICDHLGRFVGFGGRSTQTGQPKYINTSQTEIFNKSFVLYGLNWSKDAIKEKNQVIIVEGYTDLISLFAKGKRNVVASLGTGFTEQHAKLLGRFGKQAIIAFDGDTAGQEATLSSMEILHHNGLQVRVATLRDGEDPDTFVRSKSIKEVDQWLDFAKPFREYQIDRIISQYDVETREGKLAASTELVTMLAKLDNALERDEYIRYGAQCLGVLGQSLAHEVNQRVGIDSSRQVQNRHNAEFGPTTFPNQGEELVEREIIRFLLRNPNYLKDLQHVGIAPTDFQHPDYRHLYIQFSQNKSDERATAITARLYSLSEQAGSWEDYLKSFLVLINKRRLEKIEEKLSSLENDRKGFDIHMELYGLLKEYYDIFNTKF